MLRRAQRKQQRAGQTLNRIGRIALAVGSPPSSIALALVHKRRRKIETVLRRRGINPASKTGNLAIQAAQLTENDGMDKALEMGLAPSREELTAEMIETGITEVQEQEERNTENNPDAEADSFDPATLGAIWGAAKGAVNKINTGRESQGKAPLLRGKKWQSAKAKADKLAAMGFKKKSTADILKEAAGEVVEAKKSDEIGKMMPLIIVGIIIIFVMGKKLG